MKPEALAGAIAHDRAALQDLLGLLSNRKLVLIDTTGVAPRLVSSSRHERASSVGPEIVPLPRRSPGRSVHPPLA